MRPFRAFALALVAAMPALAGCVGEVDEYYGFEADRYYVNPGVIAGSYQNPDGNGSAVLDRGFLPYGDPEVIRLRSSTAGDLVPVSVNDAESAVLISMAVWRPIDGTADDVPLIVVAGPYFEVGFHCFDWSNPPCDAGPEFPNTINHPAGITQFLIKNYLQLGFALAQVAVRGTGTSGGCMELFGPREAADLDQAITFLANQYWSNGNVAMIGVSYDGSTPWLVAGRGNPHLKTIVPISGLPDIFDLMFHNGTSETRGPIMHSQVYWPYGFGTDFPHPLVYQNPVRQQLEGRGVPYPVNPPGQANGRHDYQDRQNLLCRDAYEGAVMGPYASVLGERGSQYSNYYNERDWRDDVLRNYRGSVFLIHGLQDWNVDPHAAVPFNQQLRDAGVRTKEWYGQWGHTLPDRSCGPKEQPRWMWGPCRTDFAEALRQWLEYELNGNTTADIGHPLQIQDNRGHWRNADSFPARNAEWIEFRLSAERKLDPNTSVPAAEVMLLPPARAATVNARNQPSNLIELVSDPFANDTRISGLPQLQVRFEAQGAGGFVAAWLADVNETGMVLDRWAMGGGGPRNFSAVGVPAIVGHAQMDLRFYQGGETSTRLQPGTTGIARMEFEPLDILVPAGHKLRLWLFQYPYADKFASPVPSAVKVMLGPQSVLRLPTIKVADADLFPVPGSHMPIEQYYDRFHVKPRTFQSLMPNLLAAREASADCWDEARMAFATAGTVGSTSCFG